MCYALLHVRLARLLDDDDDDDERANTTVNDLFAFIFQQHLSADLSGEVSTHRHQRQLHVDSNSLNIFLSMFQIIIESLTNLNRQKYL